MKPTGKMISLLPWLFQTQFASQARKKRLAAEEVVGMDDNIVVPESGIEDQPRKESVPDDKNLVTVTETFVVAEGEAVNDDLSSTDVNVDADDKVTTPSVDPATAIGEEATSSRIGDSEAVAPEAVESEAIELPLGDTAREGGAHAAMMSQAFMDALNTGLFDPKVSVHSRTPCHPSERDPKVTSHSSTRGYSHEQAPHSGPMAGSD